MALGNDRAWFGQRSYGSRTLPVSWQGWLATLLYAFGTMACFFVPAVRGLPHAELISFASFGLLTLLFGTIIVRKSRGPL